MYGVKLLIGTRKHYIEYIAFFENEPMVADVIDSMIADDAFEFVTALKLSDIEDITYIIADEYSAEIYDVDIDVFIDYVNHRKRIFNTYRK